MSIAKTRKLNLNAAFIHYFTELRKNSNLKSITLNELLTHVSGLPFDFDPSPKNDAELICDLHYFKLSDAPASEYIYSNAGIGIVGYILQKIYAMPYQALLIVKILKPLILETTYLNVPLEKQQNIAVGHTKNNQIVAYTEKLDIWFAAASLKSSISDLAKYLYGKIHVSELQDKTLAQAFIMPT